MSPRKPSSPSSKSPTERTAFSADERRHPPMKTDDQRTKLDRLTERIIGCAFEVSNTLGCGFLEKVYGNALAIELQQAGMRAEQQRPIQVRYKDELVGEGVLDLLVEEAVIVEVKAMEELNQAHTAQCLNYLKATQHQVCLPSTSAGRRSRSGSKMFSRTKRKFFRLRNSQKHATR